MSSPEPPSVWPCPPEALADQICQAVQAAFHDSADTFAQNMQTLTSTPSKDGVQAFFSDINPLLTKNLKTLQSYILRNVFSIPPGVDSATLASAIQSHQIANAEIASLDNQIATVRARIRQCDNVIGRLTAAQKTAEREAAALHAVAPESVSPEQFETLCADLTAAEQDFVDVTNILKDHRTNAASNDPLLQAVAKVVAKPTGLPTIFNVGDENAPTLRPSEEHEPLNHMPSAEGILGISMGADTERLQDLATLRARLLG